MPFNQTGRISRAIVAVAGKSFRLADYFSGLLDGISAMDFGSYIACCYKANRTPMFRQLLSDRNYGNAITEAAITFCGNYLDDFSKNVIFFVRENRL
jgi:hypothetical protein